MKSEIMDLQADINWIKNELNNVRDPHLIEAFKNLLTYRKTKSNRLTRKEFIADIKEAEEQIEKGDYLSIEDFEDQAKKWA